MSYKSGDMVVLKRVFNDKKKVLQHMSIPEEYYDTFPDIIKIEKTILNCNVLVSVDRGLWALSREFILGRENIKF